MTTKQFKDFKWDCELLCNQLRNAGLVCDTIYKNNKMYGWYSCVFIVDRFGGSACQIKRIDDKWLFTDFKDTFECEHLDIAFLFVPLAVRKEMEVRLTPELTDFINSQYD